ncbi:MAG: T9SS type A sorting domain-containing protein [Candidatus Marinimicrobia bacterium]|nr:T9SS type A sorting domain-containing protein [Candidatus Neomarinimicrobiota bacterium]
MPAYITHPELQGQGSVTYRTEYTYVDNTVIIGKTYDYRLADVSYDGVKEYHNIMVLGVSVIEPIPEKYILNQAYPNPFNPATSISFHLPESQFVSLSVYDLTGRLVTTLVEEHLAVGRHTVSWDAGEYGSGVYLYQIRAGEFTQTKKMLLLK